MFDGLRKLVEAILALFKPVKTPPQSPPGPPPSPPPPASPPPQPPPSNPPPATSDERDRYLACLARNSDWQYEYGASGPTSADCSGYVAYCFRDATGRDIPGGADSHAQYARLPMVSRAELLSGDLAFYDTMNGTEVREGNTASHVNTVSQMYPMREIGMMNPDLDVEVIDPTGTYWEDRLLGYRRPPFTGSPSTTPAPTRVTTTTPFRHSGTIPVERMVEILKGYPLESEARVIHEAVRGQCLPVAQAWRESRYGQDESAQKTHNPLGLLWYPGMFPVFPTDSSNSHGVPLIVFSSWNAAFREWQRRMDDPSYKNGVYMPENMTLRDYFSTYVGGPECKTSGRLSCANNETKASIDDYEQDTVARINRYLGVTTSPPSPPSSPPSSGTSYAVAGLPIPIQLSFPLKQKIVPSSRTLNRPGIHMMPDRYVQHETDNTNPGAGAAMHADYLYNGAEGRQASWHFTVDDKEAYQSIPVNEVSWHGGDGDGPCNMRGVSCELCVNMIGDPARMARARHNAEELAARIADALHLSLIEGHTNCCSRQGNPAGCHSGCPRYMIEQNYWPQKFLSAVASLRQ